MFSLALYFRLPHPVHVASLCNTVPRTAIQGRESSLEVSFLFMTPHPTLLPSRAQEESTGLLSGLRIWHTQLLPGGLQGLILNPVFRQNLRIALLGGYVIPFSS